MGSRLPFIKSFSSKIVLIVLVAAVIFSYGIFLHIQQAKARFSNQYLPYVSSKKQWITSATLNRLESAIENDSANTRSYCMSGAVCRYPIRFTNHEIQIIDNQSGIIGGKRNIEVIESVIRNSIPADNNIHYLIQRIENSYYFLGCKIPLKSNDNSSGSLAILEIPADSILLQLIHDEYYIIQSALILNDTILWAGNSSHCLKNEINSASLSAKTFRSFKCKADTRQEKFLWVKANLFNDIQLILIIQSVKSDSSSIFYLITSYFLLFLGILLFPVFERRKNQKQIREINNAIEQISQKEFNILLSEDYPGELGTLTRSLNKMSSQLKEMYQDLELRVIRRTSGISLRNAELRKKQREILQQNQEIKSAYEALKESREKYEKLIEHLEDEYFFYSISLNGTLLFVSPSVKKILGYEVKEYRKIHDRISTNSPLNKIARERERNLKVGVAQPKYLKEVFDVNKNEKILEVSEVPVFNDDGQLVSIEGLAHDITERQKAEEMIKEQEEKYRMLFTHASDFILLYKIDRKNNTVGNIIEANHYTLNKLGYNLKELREMSPLNLLAVEINTNGEQEFDEIAMNESTFERIWESKDGQTIDVEISAHAFKIKDKEVAIAVARDITERKKAEEEIRFINEELVNQKENLESLVDNLTETQEQLVQSEKMAALGQLIAGIAHEINTPLGAIKASIGNMLDSLHTALEELPELFQKQSVENLILFNNIFEKARKKKAEFSSREKRQKRRELASILKQHEIADADLVADALVYLEIYESDDKMLNSLKNTDALKVVRSARNFISLMKNTNTINLAVEKATKVVFALKKYAHRDAMGEKVSTDITDSIETVLTLYHNQLKQGIEIVRDYGKIPLVQCYQDEISQVWTNLIQNAIQAMHLEGTLTITTRKEGNFVVISFKDDGPGVEPDIIDKIFEPFFTTKKQGEGSGLGLDIVKKIIEKHNGTIDLESKLGEGANFIIKLPLEKQES